MSSEREDNRALADRLRGMAVSEAHAAGKELSTQVGRVQTVNEISGPAATPSMAQEQTTSVRERFVAQKQEQNQVGNPGQEQRPSQTAPEQRVEAAKDRSLAETAQELRQAGVTGGRAANDVAPPKQTPEVAQRQSQGRGR